MKIKSPNKRQKGQRELQQMRAGLLEFVVLLVIWTKAAYAKEILQKLSETEFRTTEGTLYPLLNKLKKADLLKQNWEETNSGPPRKYYYLTPDGERHLSEMTGYWKNLSETISLFQARGRDTQN